MAKEVWKDVKGWEGFYQVSSLGRFKGVERLDSRGYKQKERIMKGYDNGHGYIHVYGSKNGIVKTLKLHRIIAEAFIPNPNNLPCVNHKDENRANNHVDNLEWCTYSYNNTYGDRIDRIKESKGWKKQLSDSKTPIYVIENGNKKWYKSQAQAAEELGLDKSNLNACLKGRIKSHRGYTFEYA